MRLTALRIPADMERNIAKVAKETNRSKSFIIREAVGTYLEDYFDCKTALHRLNDNADKLISVTEMKKRLGL